MTGPRRWQREVLEEIGAHLANPATRHTPLRLARASGHGIGKSALVAMIVKWALDTCPDARVLVTANTESQLDTKTAPEIAKWAAALTAGLPRRAARWHRPHRAVAPWRADLVTWSEHNTEAFAGLHNMGRRIVLIFDEASGIADKGVGSGAGRAMTDADTELIWLAFGNPTQNTGAFRECFGKHRNLWRTAQIDAREVEGVNTQYLDELVAAYGADSDVVRVRVRGQFPSSSTMQFIPQDLAEPRGAAGAGGLPTDPVIFGVDCARFGDDESVLAIRCGRDARSRPWKSWRGVDAMRLAGDIA
jgi:hypothetical protein